MSHLVRNLLQRLDRIRTNPLAQFAVAYSAAAALQKALGFALFFWLARSLTVEEYATFGLLYALQTALATLAGAGIVESAIGLIKKYSSEGSLQKLWSSANTVLAILSVLFSVSLVSGYLILATDEDAALGSVLAVVAVGILTAFFSQQASLVRLEEKHRASLVLTSAPPAAAIAGGAIGFLVHPTVAAVYIGMAMGLVLVLIPLIGRRVGSYAFGTDKQDLTNIFSRISPFVLIAALMWLTGYGNTYLISFFYDATHVAQFTFAYTVSSVMQLVATSLNQVWSPRFFRLVHTSSTAEVERSYERFSLLQGAVLGVVGGTVLVLLPPILQLAGGNLTQYADIDLEYFLLFMAYVVSMPWWHSQNHFYAHNRGRTLMSAIVWGSALGLLLTIAAMWALGPRGAYLGLGLQMLARTATTTLRARNEWTVTVAWRGMILATAILVAAFALSAQIK